MFNNFNVSGNFNTAEREVSVVKKLFELNGVKFQSISKHIYANAGDVLVILENGKHLVIEVKEEKFNRFQKYGDLGIDLLSVFQFKKPELAEKWKGVPKSGQLINDFFNDVDMHSTFKRGKISYSKSDLWLFFTVDPENQIQYYSFFPGDFMKSKEFKLYLKHNCVFTVNNKPCSQLSSNDPFHSAVFFINHKDSYLNSHKFNLKKLAKNSDSNDPRGNSQNFGEFERE